MLGVRSTLAMSSLFGWVRTKKLPVCIYSYVGMYYSCKYTDSFVRIIFTFHCTGVTLSSTKFRNVGSPSMFGSGEGLQPTGLILAIELLRQDGEQGAAPPLHCPWIQLLQRVLSSHLESATPEAQGNSQPSSLVAVCRWGKPAIPMEYCTCWPHPGYSPHCVASRIIFHGVLLRVVLKPTSLRMKIRYLVYPLLDAGLKFLLVHSTAADNTVLM